MSDPKSSYGEPVEEPGHVDDVVSRANEGLAEAEAARRDPVADAPASETDAPAAAEEPAPGEGAAPRGGDARLVENGTTEPSPAAAGEPAEPDPWDSPEAASLDHRAPAADRAVYTPADDSPTVVAAPVVTASEPVADTAYASAATPQPIFVQAPEAPRPRGNRAAAGAIGLLAAVSFAILYFAVWLGVGAIRGEVTGANVAEVALATLGTWSLWVPVVVFFLAFWLLGAIINRGRWGAWVIFGLLVGFAAYGGHILGALFQAPFWELTASQGAELVEAQLLTPMAFAAFVIGRELTVWFGAWAAARGRRVTELNVEAQREYERTLEAGPQIVRP
jgi:hypothetical protein